MQLILLWSLFDETNLWSFRTPIKSICSGSSRGCIAILLRWRVNLPEQCRLERRQIQWKGFDVQAQIELSSFFEGATDIAVTTSSINLNIFLNQFYISNIKGNCDCTLFLSPSFCRKLPSMWLGPWVSEISDTTKSWNGKHPSLREHPCRRRPWHPVSSTNMATTAPTLPPTKKQALSETPRGFVREAGWIFLMWWTWNPQKLGGDWKLQRQSSQNKYNFRCLQE